MLNNLRSWKKYAQYKQNMFRLLTIIISCLFIISCSNFHGKFVEYKRLLPDPNYLPCCWQIREKVEIISSSKQISFSAVTVISENKLVVVIFDPLGRRLLNISQTGRQVKVEKEKEITLELPMELLLLGIFLVDMPDSGWSFKGSNWLVERSGNKKILRHANRVIVSLTKVNLPENQMISNLYYHDLDLEVKITRLEKQRL
jgi:hypothetical protein